MSRQLLPKSKLALAAVLGASFIIADLIAIAIWKFMKKKLKTETPKKWRKVGEISDLICYPIKSCGWIRINEFDCKIIGLESSNIRDRTFMVVKADGEFVTARKYPKLVQVMPDIKDDVMILSAPKMNDIQISFVELLEKERTEAVVWSEGVEVIDAGDDAALWFSRFILDEDAGLRLVYFPSPVPTRDVREKNKIFDTAVPEDTGALHDASSFMLINEGSVNDLNTRVEKYVAPLQFRPNFVVKGAAAYEEDNWQWVKIGDDVVLRTVKPCTRCLFTNIDPETADRHESEPLKTLKTYRTFEKTGDSPVMGIHLGVRAQGKIKLGDAVYVEDDN